MARPTAAAKESKSAVEWVRTMSSVLVGDVGEVLDGVDWVDEGVEDEEGGVREALVVRELEGTLRLLRRGRIGRKARGGGMEI